MWILAAILVILLFLLCCPVSFSLSYGEKGFQAKVGYLFFHKHFSFSQEEKKRSDKGKKSSQEKESVLDKLRRLSSENDSTSFFEFLRETAALAAGSLKKLFHHIVIKKLSLDVSVAGEDAAQTALSYGKLCALIYPAVSVLVSQTKTKWYGVSVFPDFSEQAQTKAKFEVQSRVKVLFLLSAGVGFLVKFTAVRLQKQPQKSEKGKPQPKCPS